MSVALPRILRTSSFRLTLLYAGLFGVSVLILLEVVYWATGVYISNSLDAAIDSDITELEESLRAGGIEALAAQVQGTGAANAGWPDLLSPREFKRRDHRRKSFTVSRRGRPVLSESSEIFWAKPAGPCARHYLDRREIFDRGS